MSYGQTFENVQKSIVLHQVGTDQNGPYDVVIGSSSATQRVEEKTRSGVVTPNYKLVAKTGRLPDNPFQYDMWELSGAHNVSVINSPLTPYWQAYYRQWFSYGTREIATGPYGIGTSYAEFDENRNSINSKLLAAAKGSQWNVPIFLAEGRKTLDMVTETASRLVRMALALKHGNLQAFAKMAHVSSQARIIRDRRSFGKRFSKDPKGTFGNSWLEYSYGWSPFVGDVHSAMVTLMDTAERPETSDGSVTARHSPPAITETVNDMLVHTSINGDKKVYGSYETIVKRSQRDTWRFTVKPEDIPGRFGLLNPLEVVWELVPLSFVVDWFLPVGTYLSSLDATLRFNHLGGTRGDRVQTLFTTTPTRMTPTDHTFTGFSGQGSRVRVRRLAMTQAPSLSLLNVGFKNPMSWKHAASSLALLHQLLK